MNYSGYTSSILTATLRDHVPCLDLVEVLPLWTINQRKALLTCCRTQTLPTQQTALFRRLKPVLLSTFYNPKTRHSHKILDYILQADILTSPILSGLVSMAARSMPYDDLTSVFIELEDGIRKELLASVEIYHPSTFNWISYLSGLETSQDRFHPGYPILPELDKEVAQRFRIGLVRISRSVLYPDYSKKTLGREARSNMHAVVERHFADLGEDVYSTWGLERIYHALGFKLSGKTEVRWAWKYNDLKPRIYYARGPDQYYASRYIQEIFNNLIDQFPNTNRFERYHTLSLRGCDTDTCFIYDYSAFTSSLQEVNHFIRSLAYLSRGIVVNLVDTHVGLIQRGLEDLLLEYVEACNEFIRFDATKISDSPLEDEIFPVHTCGMLGVPGNISSCTLLHGLHLAHILQSLHRGKAVGDDAVGWTDLTAEGSKEVLVEHLGNIGRISEPKMYFFGPRLVMEGEFSDNTWNYLKRPATRVENRLVSVEQSNWPSPEVMLSSEDAYHTLFPPRTVGDKIKKCCNMLLSFSLQFRFSDPSEIEAGYIDRFIRSVGRKMEKMAGEEGIRVDRIYPRGFRTSDVIGDLVDDYWNTRVVLPIEYTPESETAISSSEENFGRMNKAWKLLSDLGYVESELMTEPIVVRSDPARLEKFLSSQLVPLYKFSFLSKPPSYLFSLLDLHRSILPSVSMDPSSY